MTKGKASEFEALGDGHTAGDIVREYPELEEEDVYQAARFESSLRHQRHTPMRETWP